MTPVPMASAGWRALLADRIEHGPVQVALIALILINAAVLGLETVPSVTARWGESLAAIDRAILAVFVVEIGLRLLAHGWRFFRDPWSVFDFIVVGIALLPAAGPFAVLRALRVLRVLRLATMVPSMRRVVGGLLGALPGLGAVFALILLIFYVAAVIATKLFGQTFPAWFGTLGESAYTLFQVMTLESWSMGIARPVIEAHPYAWIFFVVFILVSTFTMLNLFIAVIVNAMQSEALVAPRQGEAVGDEGATAATAVPHAELRDEIRALRAEVAALRRQLGGG
jgi:voltage-gated sodium channel